MPLPKEKVKFYKPFILAGIGGFAFVAGVQKHVAY